MHSILISVLCIFFILYNDQQMHKYFTNYHTPATCFDAVVVIPRESLVSTLPRYTSMSNAVVGNIISNLKLFHIGFMLLNLDV
jgi:hypothetical protein